MSKAQEKRNKQFRESLTNRLTVLFNPFRNYNYKSYVDSKIRPHTDLIESHWGTYSNKEEAFEALEGQDDLSRTLTPKGEKQALRMSQWLDRQLPEGVRVMSSPAVRCEQTVKHLGRKVKYK